MASLTPAYISYLLATHMVALFLNKQMFYGNTKVTFDDLVHLSIQQPSSSKNLPIWSDICLCWHGWEDAGELCSK